MNRVALTMRSAAVLALWLVAAATSGDVPAEAPAPPESAAGAVGVDALVSERIVLLPPQEDDAAAAAAAAPPVSAATPTAAPLGDVGEESDEEDEPDAVTAIAHLQQWREAVLARHREALQAGARQPSPPARSAADKPDTGEAAVGSPMADAAFNYASASAGAKVLSTSADSKAVASILEKDRDKYMMSPCNSRKWFIVQLSEDIVVESFAVANYEHYSSSIKDFQILGSEQFPTNRWLLLGTFTAKNVNEQQMFVLRDPVWVRFLKLRWVSHYGSEYWCTLSSLEVFGRTMLDAFRQDMEVSSQEVTQLQQTILAQMQAAPGAGEPEPAAVEGAAATERLALGAPLAAPPPPPSESTAQAPGGVAAAVAANSAAAPPSGAANGSPDAAPSGSAPVDPAACAQGACAPATATKSGATQLAWGVVSTLEAGSQDAEAEQSPPPSAPADAVSAPADAAVPRPGARRPESCGEGECDVGPSSGAGPQARKANKMSIFAALTERIKVLEMNQSVANVFLDALAQRLARALKDTAEQVEDVRADTELQAERAQELVSELNRSVTALVEDGLQARRELAQLAAVVTDLRDTVAAHEALYGLIAGASAVLAAVAVGAVGLHVACCAGTLVGRVAGVCLARPRVLAVVAALAAMSIAARNSELS